MTAAAALLLAIPAVQAQKVNKDALLSKIEKSNEAVADAKKGAAAVYAAGDARNGSSLVVSAIADAMACAGEVAAELGL